VKINVVPGLRERNQTNMNYEKNGLKHFLMSHAEAVIIWVFIIGVGAATAFAIYEGSKIKPCAYYESLPIDQLPIRCFDYYHIKSVIAK
jgi:hypothetical protein